MLLVYGSKHSLLPRICSAGKELSEAEKWQQLLGHPTIYMTNVEKLRATTADEGALSSYMLT